MKPLEGGRFETHENGTLHINGTMAEDGGAYSCWVINAKGKAAITASLDVHSESTLRFLHVDSHVDSQGLCFPQ